MVDDTAIFGEVITQTEVNGTINNSILSGTISNTPLQGTISSVIIGGTTLDYKEYTVDRTYTYQGADGLTYVPIPYGCRYPINKSFDGTTDYNFCEELYINETLLIKDVDWREANLDEINGFMAAGTYYTSGMGSIHNFAHMVILLGSNVLNNTDTVRMKITQRRLLNTKVEGIRLGNTTITSTWGDEVLTATYNYAINDGLTNNLTKTEKTGVFWAYPIETKYKVCLFFLCKKGTGHYSGGTQDAGKHHQGQTWRYLDYRDSIVGKFELAPKNNHGAFKLAVFDIETGAMSDLCVESICRKFNKKWSGVGGPILPSVVLR